jgi:glyoxylate reductase
MGVSVMKRILLTGNGYSNNQLLQIKSLNFNILHIPEVDSDTLTQVIPDLDAYILGGSERLDANFIAKADKLEFISFVGTGYGTFIDAEAAKQKGITIANTPEIMTNAVTEHTLGLLIGLARGLFAQNEASKRLNSWNRTKELSHLKIGIVGMGRIGTKVAKILTQGFNCTVYYTALSKKENLESEIGIQFADIDRLFAESDVIILLVPSTPQTYNIVNWERLSLARPGLMLINTASANLVDPSALLRALENGLVDSAAFDGYWKEPLPDPQDDSYGFLKLPDSQFVITPHSAAKTKGTWERMISMAVDNLLQYYSNFNL